MANAAKTEKGNASKKTTIAKKAASLPSRVEAASKRRRRAAKGEDGGPSAADYSRQSPREHVLLRPQMYVGSTEPTMPVVSPLSSSGDKIGRGTWDFVGATVTHVAPGNAAASPALTKVVDEILVNAADNAARDPAGTRNIVVTIDADDARISIANDGLGLPVEVHPTEGLWVPELVFGNLLTGSNFDDTEQRTTGGRHGYGAKLTNILSESFTVETADPGRGLSYHQTWTSNMGSPSTPNIEPLHKFENIGEELAPINVQCGFTRVSFKPDKAHLISSSLPKSHSVSISGQKAGSLSAGDVSALRRRVVELAACIAKQGVSVHLNGERIPVTSFGDFAHLFVAKASPATQGDEGTGSKVPPPSGIAIETKANYGRWEVSVASASLVGLRKSPSSKSYIRTGTSGGHVSYVNSMATPRGGAHVKHVTSQVSFSYPRL